MFPLLVVLVLSLARTADARASDQDCDGWGNWVRGAEYGQMNVETYSVLAGECEMSVEPDLLVYKPGQVFTLKITPTSSKMGIKAILVGGARFQTVSSGGKITQPYCVDYDRRTYNTEMTFVTPQAGEVRIKALCGTYAEMHVAEDIVLQLSENVTMPTASPAATPTISPSISPITASTNQPTPSPSDDYDNNDDDDDDKDDDSASEDPNYKYKKVFNSMMSLYYKQNETHGAIKLTKQKGGYLSIGVGKRMVPSICLVAVDWSVNPDFTAAIGLYNVLNMGGDLEPLATTSDALYDLFGLEQVYFTSTSQVSELYFTVDLAKQSKDFFLFKPYHSWEVVDIVYAAGAMDGEYGMHPLFGGVRDVDFSKGGELLAPQLGMSMMIHVVTMTLGWGVFVPLSIIVRFVGPLQYQTWLQLHTYLSLWGLGLNVIGYLSGWYYVHHKKGIHLYDEHGQLGLAIFLVAFLQPILGYGRHLIKRQWFTSFHLGCGFVLIFLALGNNVLGLRSFQMLFGERFGWYGQQCNSGYFNGTLGWMIMLITLVFGTGVVFVLGGTIKEYITEAMTFDESGDDEDAYVALEGRERDSAIVYCDSEEEEMALRGDLEQGLSSPFVTGSGSQEEEQRSAPRVNYLITSSFDGVPADFWTAPLLNRGESAISTTISSREERPVSRQRVPAFRFARSASIDEEEEEAVGFTPVNIASVFAGVNFATASVDIADAAGDMTVTPTPPPPPPAIVASGKRRPAIPKGGRLVSLREYYGTESLQMFKGLVYDFTPYLDQHPGGAELIVEAGKDITDLYEDQGHSKRATAVLKKYLVGVLEE